MSAFVVIGIVVVAVAARVTWVTCYRCVDQPNLEWVTRGVEPEYSIADAEGRVLSQFVPRFDIEMSPRAMWQAHTPLRMAESISLVLGGEPSAEELLELFFPDAVDGRIVVDAWELSARQTQRLRQWLSGEAENEDGETGEPIEGMWIERGERALSWRLVWEPLVVLSVEQRERHGLRSAWRWGRHLTNHIASALLGPEMGTRGSGNRLLGKEGDALRAEVWSGLIPRAGGRPLKSIPSSSVMDLRALLQEEGVATWQMRVAFGRDRVYPTGEHELYGSWGFTNELDTEPVPREGLELICSQLLDGDDWRDRLERCAPTYRWLFDRTVRGERANSFQSYVPASLVPIVQTSLDLELQHFLRAELERVLEEHRPALAMAIVVDVETGDVLAVDSVEEYPVQPFAPVYHTFTTGSTFKILTMASALEEGVVRPEELIDVGQGAYRIEYVRGPRAGRTSGRTIREAEGALTGVISARDAFAFSVNAGLTQIGLRMEDRNFRGYLEELGYGELPGSGLGSERAGFLAELPWSYAYTHASVSFGHEISSTVWQHAAALATVIRGGVYRPLRLVQAVDQGDRRYEIAPDSGKRVFSAATCATVREMMQHGADVGTGDDVRLQLEELVQAFDPDLTIAVGTKTGTAQKVPGEICVHVEMAARKHWKAAGTPVTNALYRGLRAAPKPHPQCYTSSIVVFGKLAGSDRELMTFVVVEEPRGKERFGSHVAGPAAARILAEAYHLTIGGRMPEQELGDGFYDTRVARRNLSREPWHTEAPTW